MPFGSQDKKQFTEKVKVTISSFKLIKDNFLRMIKVNFINIIYDHIDCILSCNDTI